MRPTSGAQRATTAWDALQIGVCYGEEQAAGVEVDDEQGVFRGEDERMGVVNRDIGACQWRRKREEGEGSGEEDASFLIKATCPSRGGDIPVISIVSSPSRTLHTAPTTRCFYRSIPRLTSQKC